MTRAKLPMIGRVFGFATAVAEALPSASGLPRWACDCACGKTFIAHGADLRRGHTRSCGCLQVAVITAVVGTKNKAYKHGKSVKEHKPYYQYMRTASQKGRTFQLTPDEFWAVASRNCSYCGVEPKADSLGLVRNGIDRVNSAEGYIRTNIVPCCTACNYAKNDMNLEQFINHIEMMYLHTVSTRKERDFG